MADLFPDEEDEKIHPLICISKQNACTNLNTKIVSSSNRRFSDHNELLHLANRAKARPQAAARSAETVRVLQEGNATQSVGKCCLLPVSCV